MRHPSIAGEVLGVTNFAEPDRAFREALITLNGHDNVGSPYFDPPPTGFSPRVRSSAELEMDTQQRVMCVNDVHELIYSGKVTAGNSLTHWTQYNDLMRSYGTKKDGSATALMIGSLNALSSRSFVCLAKTVYGADRAVILDPVGGKDKVRHGNFVYGDGLASPIRDESMDFVQTDNLIHIAARPLNTKQSFKAKSS